MGGCSDLEDVKATKRISNVEAQDFHSQGDCTHGSQLPKAKIDSFTRIVLSLLLFIF